MELFKYCNQYGRLTLANLEIKVTPPNELNDPCEMRPVVKVRDPHAWAEVQVKQALTDESFFDRHKKQFAAGLTFQELQTYGGRAFDSIVDRMAIAAPTVDQHLQDNILALISAKWGVVSLSANQFHELMWAHYGDSHKGLMIGFDGSKPLFTPPTLLQCEYTDKPAVYDPSISDDHAQVEQFARRKRSNWSYEKEYRLVIPLRDCRKETNGGSTRYLSKIEPALITSVTFGLRTPPELKKDVGQTLRKPEFHHVTQWQIVEGNEPGDFRRASISGAFH